MSVSGPRPFLPVVVLALVGASASPRAAEEHEEAALALFERMATAVRTLNYDGVFVYQRGGRTDTMRVIHKADGQREEERLFSLSGAAREVIRNDEAVTCIFSDNDAIVLEKRDSRRVFSGFSRPASELARNYRFRVLGQDRVAGRLAWVVGIQPRNAFRYGRRLWIDAENHLLLRAEVVNSHGVALEQICFTQLELPEKVPEEMLKPALGAKEPGRYVSDTRAAGGGEQASPPRPLAWVATWVPEGFALTERFIEAAQSDRQAVEHMVYSDGLAMVSVFVERVTADKEPLQGFSSSGALSAFSTVAGDYQITAVGEVPPLTVREIAASVVPAGAAARP